jgi:hypothetical protein
VDWVVRAAKTGATVDLRGAQMPAVDAILVPLEVAHKAPSAITRRTDGRYLVAIDAWVGTKRQFEAQDLRAALMSDAEGSEKWGFGLTKEVANFFIYYLLQVAGFEALVAERSETVHALADVKERFRLVKEEVVDAPTWDKARHVANRLLTHEVKADLPTPPEQAKLCREIAKKGRELRNKVGEFDTALRAVCAWAGVAPNDAARVRTSSELSGWLDDVLSDSVNASCTRRLAVLHGDPRLGAFVQLREKLGGEASALAEIAGQREAFEHLAAHGSEDDRTVVVVRLRNLLSDSASTVLLADKANPWASEAKRRYALMATDAAARARKDEERIRAAEQKVKEEAQRADAERRGREQAEATAKADRQGREEAERQLAEQQQREQAERARSRTVVRSRELIAAAVQSELGDMLEANPNLTHLRVRIVVDPAEPGES